MTISGRGTLLKKATAAAAFVLSEIDRISALSVADRLARLREQKLQALHGLLWGHPNYAPLECGPAAADRFEQIVDLANMRHPDLAQDCSRKTLHRALVFAFVERYVRSRKAVDASSVSAVVDATTRHVRKSLVERRIALPCRLWSQSGPESIEIGPVIIARADRFLADPSIQWSEAASHQGQLQIARDFASKAGWIAVVELPPTDQTIAQVRAENAADAALNVLRLLLGPNRTRRLRRAQSWGPTAQHSHFEVNRDGRASISTTYAGDDELMWADWPEYVFEGDRNTVRLWAGAAIHGITCPGKSVPLQQRFVDGLKWYGDAVIETSDAGRLIKCIFSWERLVITREQAALEKTVVARASRLCELTTGVRGEELQREIGELYEMRSRLAHGSRSPYGQDELGKAARKCESVTERVLLGALWHYGGLMHGRATDNELEASFGSSDVVQNEHVDRPE